MNVSTSANIKHIKYFTYHGCVTPGNRRNNSPAADTKTDYIVSVLNRIGYNVDIISRAESAEEHYLQSSVDSVGCNTVRYFASLGNTNLLLRIINRWWMNVQFFVWCIKNLTRNEQVIVYHSLGYDAIFLKLIKLKQIKIIGEIEEIYQDVTKQAVSKCRNEYKFIEACKKYIFPTQLLDKKLNALSKPSVVIHGVYSSEKIVEEKFSDGKIHVVYGGTLDPNKGGAAAAAAAAEFLPNNYHIHICGFGDPTEIIKVVESVQSKSRATVSFEGELKGDDYKRFIQKCHIGLSTQNPNAAFNATSFPSKVLMYLSNGLKVVSIKIPALLSSAVATDLFYYDQQTSESIAEAIIRASLEDIKQVSLNELDIKCSKELCELVKI